MPEMPQDLPEHARERLVEMAARRGRFPVKWRARQTVERDGPSPVIRFTHVWGVTKGMDVAWTFADGAEGTAVTIDHDFRPNWPLVGNLIAGTVIGPHFVEPIANRTLATIKAIVEDRDPRFRPDGQPRS